MTQGYIHPYCISFDITSLCISVPRFGKKNAFAMELQSIEVSKGLLSLSPP